MRGSLLIALSALLAAGCAAKNEAPTLVPVAGVFKFNGKAASGITVALFPKDAPAELKWLSQGTTDGEGKFTVSTYPFGDGAPPGEYVVTVTGYGGNANAGLPEEFGAREASPLRVTVPPEGLKAWNLAPAVPGGPPGGPKGRGTGPAPKR